MASLTITASFLAPSLPSNTKRNNFVSAKTSTASLQKATAPSHGEILVSKEKEIGSRRGIMVAAAAAIWAVSSSAPKMVALAEPEEPKAGTLEAKKKYYPVCVTMPTARICHK